MSLFLQAALTMMLLKRTPAISYTSFSLSMLFIIALSQQEKYYKVLLTNNIALHLTFYLFNYFVEPTFFDRMINLFQCDTLSFYIGDFIVHGLPSLYTIHRLLSNNVQHDTTAQFIGLQSLALNLMYGMLNGFDLSNIYVYLDPIKWKYGWFICIAMHLSIGEIIAISSKKWFAYKPIIYHNQSTNSCVTINN